MPDLLSGVLIISESPKGTFWISGSMYVDIEGERHVVGIEVKEIPSPVDLSVRSRLELLCTAAATQVADKLHKGDHMLSPRPIEV